MDEKTKQEGAHVRFLTEQIDNIMKGMQYIRDSHPDPYIQSMVSEIIIQHMKDRKEYYDNPIKYFKKEK